MFHIKKMPGVPLREVNQFQLIYSDLFSVYTENKILNLGHLNTWSGDPCQSTAHFSAKRHTTQLVIVRRTLTLIEGEWEGNLLCKDIKVELGQEHTQITRRDDLKLFCLGSI